MSHISLTVLIADDEAAIRNGLLEAIPWSFFQAQVIGTAQDGASALAYIKQYRPDLVIIDIKMPGMDGLEVIHQAKKAGISSRFLILSGYNDFSLAQTAIRYGANGYFLKPLKIEEFKNELSQQFAGILAEKHTSAANANLESLMHTSRIFFLNQLIMNELKSSEEIQRQYSILNLNIQDQSSCIAVCTSTVSDPAVLRPLLSQAETVLSEMLSDFSCEIWAQSDRQLIAMVNLDDSAHTLSFLLTKLAAAVRSLKEQTGQRFIMAAGKTVSGLEMAAHSYTSALRALSYHIFEKEDDVYDSSIICRSEPSFSPDSISFEPLLSAMEAQDDTAVSEYCTHFIHSLFFVSMPPPDFIRGMCIYLANHTRIQFYARHPDITPNPPANGEETKLAHTVKELHDWLVSTITDCSRQYKVIKENNDPVIEAAKQFVQKNLSRNIKARDIAAEVNLSESYFTIYFKSKTGQNFRDYLLKARTEYAKQLLSEKKMSICEIAYATGYQDYRSFSRAFKNVTGISPSDYQSL